MEIVQFMFVGDRILLERHKKLLRTFIPHKVYFIRYLPEKEVEEAEKALKAELPKWVARRAQHIVVNPFQPEEALPVLLRAMIAEKRKGSQVITNLHGAPNVLAATAFLAAALANARTFYVETHHEKGKIKIGEAREINFPFLPSLPKPPESRVLLFLFRNKGLVQGKLARIAEKIGLKRLGNLEKASSGAVKLSKLLAGLRKEGLIETKRISRKCFEICLTPKGKCIAEVLDILNID